MFSIHFNTVNGAVPRLTWVVADLTPQKAGIHTMWDLCKTKWHWKRFYWIHLVFPLTIILPVFHIHLFSYLSLMSYSLNNWYFLSITLNNIVYQCKSVVTNLQCQSVRRKNFLKYTIYFFPFTEIQKGVRSNITLYCHTTMCTMFLCFRTNIRQLLYRSLKNISPYTICKLFVVWSQ
jgi:hypothetical protein